MPIFVGRVMDPRYRENDKKESNINLGNYKIIKFVFLISGWESDPPRGRLKNLDFTSYHERKSDDRN